MNTNLLLDNIGNLLHESKSDAKTYRKFTIPVNGLSKEQAKENIKELMDSYKSEIKFEKNLWIPQGSTKVRIKRPTWSPIIE